jgi:rubrerythrin
MIENENESFLIRWRGRQEGPYTAAVIEAKLAANQIGMLHEISHNDQWVTLRDYFAEREAVLCAERQAREEQERRAREDAERQAKEREEQRRIVTQNEEKFTATSQSQQEAIASTPEPLCRTCGLGRLVKLNQYRMSLPVVVIGYFLLVPSAIGMLLNILGLIFYLIGAGSLVSKSATPDKGLTVLATTLGSGFFLFFLVLSFVGGVFGWLLIMKKKVLQCSHCGAVVAAS